jgi:hypothetical protein
MMGGEKGRKYGRQQKGPGLSLCVLFPDALT